MPTLSCTWTGRGARACVPLLAALTLGCRAELKPTTLSPAASPVILISVDTLRSDRLPAYGYEGIETPHIDGLAADSVLFESVYSQYPLTLPSHASIFTGLLPPALGVRNNKGYFLAERFETLAERLGAAGHRTAGFVSSMVLRSQTGIAQGFDHFEGPGGEPTPDVPPIFAQERGDAAVARAVAWLDELDAQGSFFLFLHLFDPHTPYEAPEPFAGRYPDPYDAEVAYTDALVGMFLEELKERDLYDPSLIVFLSDHGEGLGDHVELEHGIFLYREVLQVPLLAKLPGQQRAGAREPRPAALIDVVPTILGLLGLSRADLPGCDLLGAGRRPRSRPIYSETFFGREQYGFAELRSAVEGGLHFIAAPRPELYDLREDPGERHNLLPTGAVPATLRAALDGVRPRTTSTMEITPAEEARLAALGYIGGPTRQGPAGTLPDPKDRIDEAMELWSLKDRIGKSDTLAPELRALELMAELGVRREDLSQAVANNLVEARRPRRALEALGPFSESRDPATQLTLGEIAAALGRLDEARTRFEKVLALDGANATAYRNMGILLLATDDPGAARSWLERAVKLDPESAEAWNGLGVVRARVREMGGAIEAWRRAVKLDPQLSDAWFNLAVLLRDTGDRRGSALALRRYVPLVEGAERRKGEALLEALARAP